MAKEERDILYPEPESTSDEANNDVVTETETEEEEIVEDHLGYHNFYGF